jgi:tyrosyl-tRNA synthetase
MVHGKEEADSALKAARALFSNGQDEGSIPNTVMDKSIFENGINIIDLLFDIKLIKSKSEGRRLIEQGGISLNGIKVESIDKIVTLLDFTDDKLMIKKGKKQYHQIRL